MLSMIGQMVGSSSAVVGFAVRSAQQCHHRGGLCRFGVWGDGGRHGKRRGLADSAMSVIWWLMGPNAHSRCTLFMGMGFGVNWNLAAATNDDAQPAWDT